MTTRAYNLGEVMSDEDSLAHYGVKGMRWGQRKTNDDGSAAPGLIRNRNAADNSGVTRKQAKGEINAIARKAGRDLEDWSDRSVGKQRTIDIKAARKNMKQVNRNYADAVRDIKGRKGELGRNATKVALAKAGAERYQTAAIAAQKTRGEAVVGILLDVAKAVATPR